MRSKGHFDTREKAEKRLKGLKERNRAQKERYRKRGIQPIIWYSYRIKKLVNGQYSVQQFLERRRET